MTASVPALAPRVVGASLCEPRARVNGPPQRPLLVELDVVGREEAALAADGAHPPPLVHLLDVLDDLVGIKGDLVLASCMHAATARPVRRSASHPVGNKERSNATE